MHRRRAVVACPSTIHYAEDGEQESFVKHRLLGYGGFAAVYEVERVSDGCRIAAKVLPLSSLADANKLRRVQNEIDINQLVHHPHVVTFLGSFQDQQNVYLLQELCCVTLSELLRRLGRLTELQAAHIVWQVLSALEHLHGCGVAHRDLKLSNMFLGGDGTVKVGDLGLACHLPSPSARRFSTCGSLNWMAPEVLRPGQVGYGLEVDIWALGVMLYTLLVGRPPFATGGAAAGDAAGGSPSLPPTTYSRILQGIYRLPDPSEVPLGPQARDLIHRLLQVNPASRPSLSEVRAHPFFKLHLGPLASLTAPVMLPLRHVRSSSPLGRGPPPPLQPSRSGPDSSLESTKTSAAETDPSRTGSQLLALPYAGVVAIDLRILLREAGFAVHPGGLPRLAVSPALGECESTSGSYIELSQSEQASVATTATTTVVGGACDARWTTATTEGESFARYSHSHDPTRRSHSHMPLHRRSEQLTGSPLFAFGVSTQYSQELGALHPHHNHPHPHDQHQHRRVHMQNRSHHPHMSGSRQALSAARSHTQSFGGSMFSRSGAEAAQGATTAPSPFAGPSGVRCQVLPAGPSGTASCGGGTAPSTDSGAGASAGSSLPNPQTQRLHDRVAQLGFALRDAALGSRGGAGHGGGLDLDTATAERVAELFGALVGTGGGSSRRVGGAAWGGRTPGSCHHGEMGPSCAACYCGLQLGTSVSGGGGGGGGEEVRMNLRGTSGRSSTSALTQNSSATSTSMCDGTLSPFPTSGAPFNLGFDAAGGHCAHQQHHHSTQSPLPRSQQQQQPQQLQQQHPMNAQKRSLQAPSQRLRRGRRTTVESHATEHSSSQGTSAAGTTSGTAAAPSGARGLPVPALLRAAFLSQHHHCAPVDEVAAAARRLLNTRSACARHSALGTAAAVMLAGSHLGGLGGTEEDTSSDTARSYADSLEAMLLGGDGRIAATAAANDGGGAIHRRGPAPLTGMGYGTTAVKPGMSYPLQQRPVSPSPAIPIILRHGRSSAGTPLCRGISAAASRPINPPPSVAMTLQLLPYLTDQRSGLHSAHSAPCVQPLLVMTQSESTGLYQSYGHSVLGATAGDCTSGGEERALSGLMSSSKPLHESAECVPAVAAHPPIVPVIPFPVGQYAAAAPTNPATPCDSGPLSFAVFALTPARTVAATRGNNNTTANNSSSLLLLPTIQGGIQLPDHPDGVLVGEPWTHDDYWSEHATSSGVQFKPSGVAGSSAPRSADRHSGGPSSRSGPEENGPRVYECDAANSAAVRPWVACIGPPAVSMLLAPKPGSPKAEPAGHVEKRPPGVLLSARKDAQQRANSAGAALEQPLAVTAAGSPRDRSGLQAAAPAAAAGGGGVGREHGSRGSSFEAGCDHRGAQRPGGGCGHAGLRDWVDASGADAHKAGRAAAAAAACANASGAAAAGSGGVGVGRPVGSASVLEIHGASSGPSHPCQRASLDQLLTAQAVPDGCPLDGAACVHRLQQQQLPLRGGLSRRNTGCDAKEPGLGSASAAAAVAAPAVAGAHPWRAMAWAKLRQQAAQLRLLQELEQEQEDERKRERCAGAPGTGHHLHQSPAGPGDLVPEGSSRQGSGPLQGPAWTTPSPELYAVNGPPAPQAMARTTVCHAEQPSTQPGSVSELGSVVRPGPPPPALCRSAMGEPPSVPVPPPARLTVQDVGGSRPLTATVAVDAAELEAATGGLEPPWRASSLTHVRVPGRTVGTSAATSDYSSSAQLRKVRAVVDVSSAQVPPETVAPAAAAASVQAPGSPAAVMSSRGAAGKQLDGSSTAPLLQGGFVEGPPMSINGHSRATTGSAGHGFGRWASCCGFAPGPNSLVSDGSGENAVGRGTVRRSMGAANAGGGGGGGSGNGGGGGGGSAAAAAAIASAPSTVVASKTSECDREDVESHWPWRLGGGVKGRLARPPQRIRASLEVEAVLRHLESREGEEDDEEELGMPALTASVGGGSAPLASPLVRGGSEDPPSPAMADTPTGDTLAGAEYASSSSLAAAAAAAAVGVGMGMGMGVSGPWDRSGMATSLPGVSEGYVPSALAGVLAATSITEPPAAVTLPFLLVVDRGPRGSESGEGSPTGGVLSPPAAAPQGGGGNRIQLQFSMEPRGPHSPPRAYGESRVETSERPEGGQPVGSGTLTAEGSDMRAARTTVPSQLSEFADVGASQLHAAWNGNGNFNGVTECANGRVGTVRAAAPPALEQLPAQHSSLSSRQGPGLGHGPSQVWGLSHGIAAAAAAAMALPSCTAARPRRSSDGGALPSRHRCRDPGGGGNVLGPPPVLSSGRHAASATGMYAGSGGGIVAPADSSLPEMDPGALAELANRLRSRSVQDSFASSRNGSFTYRPSRMMPAAHRSPSRRVIAAAGAAAGTPAAAAPSPSATPAADAMPAGPERTAVTSTVVSCGVALGPGPGPVPVRDVLMVKWLDYSAKYGLSYVLSNGAVGVLFRDGTQLLREPGASHAWLLGGPIGKGHQGGGGSNSFGNGWGFLLLPQHLPVHAHAIPLGPNDGGGGGGGCGDDSAAGRGEHGFESRHQHDIQKKLRLLRSFEHMLLGSEDAEGGKLERLEGGPASERAGERSHAVVAGAAEAAEAGVVGQDGGQAALQQRSAAGQALEPNVAAGALSQSPTAATTGGAAAAAPATPAAVQRPAVVVTWWTRTHKALVLCLSSGTLQALFCDGSELVLREQADEVDFMARDGRRSTCSLRAVRSAGSSKNSIAKRIQYVFLLLHSRAGEHE